MQADTRYVGVFVAATLRLLAILTFGCATLGPEAQAVRVTTNPDVVKGCRYLGEVQGNGAIHFYEGAGDDWQRATADIKNNASKIGANVVFLTSSRETALQIGEAYSCPATPAPAPRPTAAPGG